MGASGLELLPIAYAEASPSSQKSRIVYESNLLSQPS